MTGREFYELPGGYYVETQDPGPRKAPSPHHIFVSERPITATLMRSAGWLDTEQYRPRKLDPVTDSDAIERILVAEAQTAALGEVTQSQARAASSDRRRPA